MKIRIFSSLKFKQLINLLVLYKFDFAKELIYKYLLQVFIYDSIA